MRILWLFPSALVLAAGIANAAEPYLLSSLATSVAPPCSVRPGVRATRSSLVELKDISASLSSQALRDGKTCTQTSALGVTVKDVSEQFELLDPSARQFGIQDIASDGSAVLLTSLPVSAASEGSVAEMAVVPVADGSVTWMQLGDLLQMSDCDAVIQPQGFLDAKRVLIAVAPPAGAHQRPNCMDKPEFYSFELNSHRVAPATAVGVTRQAHPVSGPYESCKTDPDLVGACYRTRARLALNNTGDGMLLWPLGSEHYFSVEPEMVPSALAMEISPAMRIYANMLVCPMLPQSHETRAHVCIDSANDFRADPITPKTGPAAAAGQDLAH